MASAFRYWFFVLGLLHAIPLLALLYLAIGISISSTGIVYLIGYFLFVSGLICAPWLRQRALMMAMTGISILLITAFVRILFPPSGSKVSLITLPGPSGPRLLARLFNEQDIVPFGAKIAPFIGFVSPLEQKDLIPGLAQAFQELHTQGVTSLQCWLIAETGSRVGAWTLCPSTDPSGQWWNEKGVAILQESMKYMKQRGVKRIYLAGLSNGGIGASRLADRFKHDLAGLILLSGADPNATITELPVLIIHGRNDERIPMSIAEQYAALSAPDSTYRLFEGDHFVLLKKADQVKKTITGWLVEQEMHSR